MVEVLTCQLALHGYGKCAPLLCSKDHHLSLPSKGIVSDAHSLVAYRPRKMFLFRNSGLEMCISDGWLAIPRVKCVITSKESSIQSNAVNIEFESSCEEENAPANDENERLNENMFQQKLPLLKSLVHKKDINSSAGAANLSGSRVYYLEERNEDVLSKRILKLSRSNKVRSALGLYKSMIFTGLRPNLHACNSLLSCILRNGMLDDALEIFEFLKEGNMTTAHTYSLILKAVAKDWGDDAALQMFEEMCKNSDTSKGFDVVVYNTMISVFGKLNNWVQAEKIWRILQNGSLVGTAVTYSILICLFVRCGQNELALDAYSEMVQNGLTPDDDVMQAIIGACVKEGNHDMAFSMLQGMLNRGLKPNAISCNVVINSLGKAGKPKLAFKVYDLMKSLGHVPDAYTWNALLGSLNQVNQHADAIRFFQRIRKQQNNILNLHIYNTILISYQRLGQWEKAVEMLWEMEASGHSISTSSYNLVIGACEVARKPKVALQVYNHMIHQKCSPDLFTLLSLIRSCIWGSLWDEVEEILNHSAPNGSLYNAAIQGMCLTGRIDLARKVYTKMHQSGLKADGKTRALMLQNLPKDLRR
nr:pentatricopeptide repeat-containing protein At3g29290 [Ipomoea batatas]